MQILGLLGSRSWEVFTFFQIGSGHTVCKHELAFLARIFCDLPWEFDQKSYSEDFPGNGGLDTSGYIYVPTRCQWANCNLLLFLHGCIGAKEYVGDKVIVQAGFLEGIRTMLHIIFLRGTRADVYSFRVGQEKELGWREANPKHSPYK